MTARFPRYCRAFSWSLLLLLVALAGCGGSQITTKATPTLQAVATLAPSPTLRPVGTPLPTPDGKLRPPVVNGPLGAAPTDCPASPKLQALKVQNFGGGFSGTFSALGASPAWLLGLGDGSSPVSLTWESSQPWPSTKVMWVIGPDYSEPVTLAGHEVRTNMPLWFQLYPSNAVPTRDPNADSVYTTRAMLDPAAPNRGSADNSAGHWNIWGLGVIALAVGCYELDVTWPEGNWSAIYSFGGKS